MKEIALSRGQSALVDDHWFDRLSVYTWCCTPGGYAFTETKSGYRLYMHRLIAGTPADLQCDHINRNRLDNQEHNLRNVTRAENMKNRGPRGSTRFAVPATGVRRQRQPRPAERIQVKEPRTKARGILVSLDANMIAEADAIARKLGCHNRSAIVRRAVHDLFSSICPID